MFKVIALVAAVSASKVVYGNHPVPTTTKAPCTTDIPKKATTTPCATTTADIPKVATTTPCATTTADIPKVTTPPTTPGYPTAPK
ncbi:hypothetical protein HDV01_004867, partial [Terramyces sp. JEL0728]